MLLTSTTCLLLLVAMEAGSNEVSDTDRQLVAKSVEVRAKSNKTSCIQEVSKPKQYSWYNGKGPYSVSAGAITNAKNSLKVFNKVSGKLPPVQFFHSTKTKPSWTKNLVKVCETSVHVYYKVK